MNENSIELVINKLAALHVFNFIFDEKSLVSLLDMFLNNDSPKGILF